MVNILRFTVAYLNATINVTPEMQNGRLEPTGLAKPGETRWLTGTGPGLARQESAGRVCGRFWNRTDQFLLSKTGPLPGYPDPLLTLTVVCALDDGLFLFFLEVDLVDMLGTVEVSSVAGDMI